MRKVEHIGFYDEKLGIDLVYKEVYDKSQDRVKELMVRLKVLEEEIPEWRITEAYTKHGVQAKAEEKEA